MDKYAVTYTEKPFTGMKSKTFRTKKLYRKWLSENKDILYWHQFVHTNPQSKEPKHLLADDALPQLTRYDKFTGTLQTYFETGMECMGLTFYIDGVHGGPNPDFDPTKPESGSNFKNFSSWEGTMFIETGMVITMPDGQHVCMVKDRMFAKQDGYRLSFYCIGYNKQEWIDLFLKEVKVTLYAPNAELKKEREEKAKLRYNEALARLSASLKEET